MNKILRSTILLMILGSCIGCKKTEVDEVETGTVTCEVSTSNLLEGTIYQTPVYTFTSNNNGPRVVIVGGIHGDEIAGWQAAEKLITKLDYYGTVMIIPYANIVACGCEQRYPGYGNSGKINSTRLNKLNSSDLFDGKDTSELSSVKFSDLNRIFPGNADGTVTEKIANAIYNKVIEFNPNYVVDLHEARHNYESSHSDDSTYLGSTIVSGNGYGATAALKIVNTYNDTYSDEIDGSSYTDFCKIDGTTTTGTNYDDRFCKVLGDALNENKTRVMTIETNRNCLTNGYNPTDGRDVNLRINEQLRIINIMLDQALTDYNAGKFNIND